MEEQNMINNVIEYTQNHHPTRVVDVKDFIGKLPNRGGWMISKFAKLRSVMGNGIIVPRCTSVPRGSKTAMHPESAKVYFEKYKQDPKKAAMMVKKGKFNNACK